MISLLLSSTLLLASATEFSQSSMSFPQHNLCQEDKDYMKASAAQGTAHLQSRTRQSLKLQPDFPALQLPSSGAPWSQDFSTVSSDNLPLTKGADVRDGRGCDRMPLQLSQGEAALGQHRAPTMPRVQQQERSFRLVQPHVH